MKFAELGYPANSQVFTGVSILTLNSAQKNCKFRLRIHNLQLHKSRSEQRLQHVQHQPSHQARMVFWVYLGSPSYQRGGGGREREEMALLPLSCMRYFDPAATRQFLERLQRLRRPSVRRRGPRLRNGQSVQSLGGVGGGRRRRRDLLHRLPALRRADPQKVEAINRNRHLHLTFRSPAW